MATYIPALKCVKTVLSYTYGGALSVSNRFFMTYSGTAPVPGDLEAIAAGVGSQWVTDSAAFYSENVELTIVECTDLTSETSLSESATVLAPGTRGGQPLSANDAVVVSMPTGRRYRGGHSRVYLPAGVGGDQADDISWVTGFATEVADQWSAVIEAGASAIWGGGGVFTNVMTSFYDGFTNVAYGTPTKYRRVPTGRDTAAFFEVTGYFGRDKIGSQRRRLDSA